MDIVINEFSLDGDFHTIDDFLNSLFEIIRVELVMEEHSLNLLKHYDFYSSLVTKNHTLQDILQDNSYKTRSEVRKFKALLNNLINNPPFWNDSQKHSNKNQYNCEYTDKTFDYSLAEACERDQMVLSFSHDNFKETSIKIRKNSHEMKLHNIFTSRGLLDILYNENMIEPTYYCQNWFINSKISTEYLEKEYGFDSLEKEEINIFVSRLKLFEQLSWNEISSYDGLDFKTYKANADKNWFKGPNYSGKTIYKFRANDKLRCFGYKENEIMYVLRFERDHKHSDHG
ncbi:hypothetical protein GCM10007275_02820 [Jeotgalicoccus coquinae]|uniref:Uncharacterized protein n=1 Tax=Jeotgalicoccus coquinae TaxID=709509 RepID=A0A6V7R7X2_9STAP|nr:hypothetical protein [Jeotgalicoccus coquinae]MBB6423053.1 hypothetical protein [Jeotgalicoccus coquinae]GGE11061.1 hypothetical protein GCM10007275_02820 [Jeotgalicoccus coquinae]CAD2073481.1 hypothetical protein JEOCOQ751_00630 [Jeotgalicoccus coquinae]